MDKPQKLALIRQSGVIAIMRASSSDQLIAAADAIKQGGVNVIEVTMTTPGALTVIEQATARYGESVLFGAGSVLDAETARAAILAGAAFIVAPTLDLAVVSLCNRYSIPVMPGCYTPTEMLTAWQAGADMIKLFPASVGGPPLIKAIRAERPGKTEKTPRESSRADTAPDRGRHARGAGGGRRRGPPRLRLGDARLPDRRRHESRLRTAAPRPGLGPLAGRLEPRGRLSRPGPNDHRPGRRDLRRVGRPTG